MDDNVVRIDELRLAVPGLSHAAAQRLSQEVARRLADRLPVMVPPLQLSAVQLRLPIGANATVEQMADAIVAGILRRLV